MSLDENKAALVEAHRSGDWERAKDLSQQRQKLKRRRYCPACDVRISARARTCRLHANFHPQHKRKLT